MLPEEQDLAYLWDLREAAIEIIAGKADCAFLRVPGGTHPDRQSGCPHFQPAAIPAPVGYRFAAPVPVLRYGG